MKRVILAAAAASLAAACSGGGETAMVKQCQQGGESAKVCGCMVSHMKKGMDADVFRVLTLQAEGKSEEAGKQADKLPVKKQMQLATAAVSAMQACIGK
ncbi:MAG: hypothetical protein GC155_04030 [Alphaproteobacteria bacterium]|nr:hypothetical protein [Alphaproteobacteria bacterium]